MGSVYRVRDHELDEVVALKLLRSEWIKQPKLLARFRREVRLAWRVTHRNVARTYDLGKTDDYLYLTMEFIDGMSLSDMLDQSGKLDLTTWLDIALQACQGLEAAHREEILHRDLKPDNILISRQGRVVLSDFGIAHLRPEAHQTTGGVILGTPRYMAPEQLEGRCNLDVRADIYALGAIFYEMLTGRCAWSGNNVMSVALSRLAQPPPDPRNIVPELPEEVAILVMKCMAREPADRYNSVSELIDALEAVAPPGVDWRRWYRRLPTSLSQAEAPVRKLLHTIGSGGLNAGNLSPVPSLPYTPRRSTKHRISQQGVSLAVLPFRLERFSEDVDFVDELMEELVDQFSVIPSLRVCCWELAAKQYRRLKDIQLLGKSLQVRRVVKGTVGVEDGYLRMKVRLLSPDDGFQLWVRKFSGDLSRMSELCESVVREMLTVLELDVTSMPTLVVRDPTRKIL